MQFYFEIKVNKSNNSDQNIKIYLRDKQRGNKIIDKLTLIDKNIIKF